MSLSNWMSGLRGRIEQGVESTFPAEAAAKLEDSASIARWGVRAVIFSATCFFVWAAFAPLDQGVPTTGFVKVEGDRKTIQHPTGGIIEEILVREGDQVRANQPLIRLSPTQVQAQQGMVDGQLIALLALEAELKAEQSDARGVTYPEFLTSRRSDPQVREAIDLHNQLFKTRKATLEGEISIARESIVGLEEQIRGLQAQESSHATQTKLFQDELDSLRPLVEQGFVPRTHQFELERSLSYIQGQTGENLANIAQARSKISELKLKILQARDAFRKDAETQMSETQGKIADLQSRRIGTQDQLERVVLRAPLAGTVVGLAVHTVGGVVTAGEKLMDIVPTSSKLVIEAQIPPSLIDNVHVGQVADIHFPALDQTLSAGLTGKLVYVSADSLTDPRTEKSYYVGRVEVTPEGMAKLGKQILQPGMPADMVIKTGERTLLMYLVKPFLTRLHMAFTER